MLNNIRKKILDDIENTFGNWKRPSYSLIDDRYYGNYYEDIIKDLKNFFTVENWSDIDWDTCISLILKKENFDIYLDLSLVGKYSILMRKSVNVNEIQIITDESNAENESELLIIRLLRQNNIELLDREILCQKVNFIPLEDEELDEVFIYQVLFSVYYTQL